MCLNAMRVLFPIWVTSVISRLISALCPVPIKRYLRILFPCVVVLTLMATPLNASPHTSAPSSSEKSCPSRLQSCSLRYRIRPGLSRAWRNLVAQNRGDCRGRWHCTLYADKGKFYSSDITGWATNKSSRSRSIGSLGHFAFET